MPTATASLTINRLGMLESLTAIGPAIPARSPKAVLQSVKLTAGPDGCELLATDLEVAIRHRVLGVQCDDPVSLLLNPARLLSILRTSDDEVIYIAVDGEHTLIRGRRSEFRLPSEDVSLFPDVPAFEATAYHTVAPADLRRLIRRTVLVTDSESIRFALGGCLLEISGGNQMAMVGTDGRRLSKQVVPCEAEGEPTITGSPVIPARALKLIDRLLDGDDAQVHIAVSDKAVFVRTETATIYARLTEGRFPDYRQVFPSEAGAKVHFPEIGDLRMAVEQSSIMCSKESRGIDWLFSSGVLKFTSRSSDVGSSDIQLPIAYEGSNVEVCFYGRYAQDLLKPLADSESLTAEFTDSKSPAVFRSETGYSHVLMPLTKER